MLRGRGKEEALAKDWGGMASDAGGNNQVESQKLSEES